MEENSEKSEDNSSDQYFYPEEGAIPSGRGSNAFFQQFKHVMYLIWPTVNKIINFIFYNTIKFIKASVISVFHMITGKE